MKFAIRSIAVLTLIPLIVLGCQGIAVVRDGEAKRAYDAEYEDVIAATREAVNDLRMTVNDSSKEDLITHVLKCSGRSASVTVRIRRLSLEESRPVQVAVSMSRQSSSSGGLAGAGTSGSSGLDYRRLIFARLDAEFPVYEGDKGVPEDVPAEEAEADE